MHNLKVTIIQSEIFWENPRKNFEFFEKKIESIKVHPDLIVLPEMFSTGFTMNAVKLADHVNGKSYQFLSSLSKKKNTHICGSVIIKEKHKFFNRLLFSYPDGKICHYDKHHLFRMAKEHGVYSPGNKHLIVRINDWRIAFFVCYDLRFPVWCRNKKDYDVAVFVANWPERRSYHWKTLLLARAIENQSYIVGVNRVGTDGNGIEYSGDSAVINPCGEYILETDRRAGVFHTKLENEILTDYRKKFPAYIDADRFEIV